MAIFHDATVTSGNRKYNLLKKATYTMRLKKLEAVQRRRDFDNPAQLKQEYLFTFETIEKCKPDGHTHTIIHFTPRNFISHSDKNRLNMVLRGMLGRQMSVEEFQDFDEAELYEVEFDVEVGVKNKSDGTPMNIVESISSVPKHISTAQPTTADHSPIDEGDIW